MNTKIWIVLIILSLIFGYLLGLYIGIPKHIDIEIDYGKNINDFTKVFNESMFVSHTYNCNQDLILSKIIEICGKEADK